VGTILETTSDEFKNLYEGAGLVVSKGQGNFETLLDQRGTSSPLGDPPKKEIYFLFQSKCGVVSRVLGLSEGSMLLVGN
jgi:uncharacterized protein with ATP-grasp and redox domains